MRRNVLILAGLVGLMGCLAGCGPSQAERQAKERSRLQLEDQDQRAAEIANQAITEMNKKLGRKPPSLDLGVPADPAAKPATPAQSQQP